MSDPLDEWLARLPNEPPARDLTTRIVSAVAQRRRAQIIWRRAGAAALACALVGAVLVLISWSHVADSLAPALSAVETHDLAPALNALVTASPDTVTTWLDAGLTWQAAQAEDIGLAFVLGVALLAVGAFGGLARLLRTRAPNGLSH
jgi:hypothetical protein